VTGSARVGAATVARRLEVGEGSDEVRFVEECVAVEKAFSAKVDNLLTACKQLQLMHAARNKARKSAKA
jgi:hypothetical protein